MSEYSTGSWIAITGYGEIWTLVLCLTSELLWPNWVTQQSMRVRGFPPLKCLAQ